MLKAHQEPSPPPAQGYCTGVLQGEGQATTAESSWVTSFETGCGKFQLKGNGDGLPGKKEEEAIAIKRDRLNLP